MEQVLRKREDFAVTLRKIKKQKLLDKKRRKNLPLETAKLLLKNISSFDAEAFGLVSAEKSSGTGVELQSYQGYPGWRPQNYSE